MLDNVCSYSRLITLTAGNWLRLLVLAGIINSIVSICQRLPEIIYRRLPEIARDCQRLPEIAGDCRRLPEIAGDCRHLLENVCISWSRVMADTGECRISQVFAGIIDISCDRLRFFQRYSAKQLEMTKKHLYLERVVCQTWESKNSHNLSDCVGWICRAPM